ncbi:sensor histidine kinase [Sphingomicrobium nitratireducens]|uniref:sensor histidine kinase n=1 Tax=Sphingomicrobium nitratireducens TaxID=2964666 RepID=UPI0022405AC8|nr:ATP-binding protein [Sphingomicrobium nitratireducens]
MSMTLPVSGRLDADLRLVSADSALERLQQGAGARIGAPLAPPQMAEIARLARSLGVAVSRPAMVASENGDIDLWLRVTPDAEGYALSIEQWSERPASAPRFGGETSKWPDDEVHGVQGGEGAMLDLDPALALEKGNDNAASLLGTLDEGRGLTRLFALGEDEDGGFALLEAVATRQPFDGQKALHRASKREVLLSGEPRFSRDGDFAGYRVRVEAIDAGEPAHVASEDEEALDRTLRSPLDRIIKAADQIVDRSDGPIRSDYADYAGDIATAGRHLLSVIRSMSEQVVAEREAVELQDVAREAAGLVTAAAEAKRIDIEIEEEGEPVHAVGERRAIVQILVNILGNAIRHSPAEGTVAIVFDAEDKRATVTIADQGPGIGRADQQRIFEKFERLGMDDGTGAGLGLAISRRLARSMDGEIALDSAAGEGARFTLTLPSVE